MCSKLFVCLLFQIHIWLTRFAREGAHPPSPTAINFGLSYFNWSPLKVVPPDCPWQNMWSPRTVSGSYIWSPLLHIVPPRCTTDCAIIKSTLVPIIIILLCEQSDNPYSLLLLGSVCTLRVNRKYYNSTGAAPPTGSWT